MNLTKRIMISLLAVTMLFSSGFTTVMAETTDEETRSVLSIDAGRKYFSEDQLKQIIDKAYTNGYTSVQILLGNDGLRFFLDDMSIEVEGTTYLSQDVKDGITAGNNSYYEDPNGNALTETEMDSILSYAIERDIDIIPVINSPGHMDAILVAMEELGIEDVRYTNEGKVSERTVNIENKHAILFVQELVKIYAEYFGNSGASEIFNFGADEYANDVFSSPGWGELQKIGLYGDFITYSNTLAAIIKDAGMLPMSFNDGIYYNSDDSFGTFDKDIIISYWTSGWWGFYVANPAYFADKGHDILNTNDGWYWVLGNITEGPYNYDNALKHAKAKPFNELPGGSTVESIGSMQAIWADTPSMDHGIDRILTLMDAFSETHRDKLVRPADYTEVDEAILNIPEDLSVYTDESINMLIEARDAVVNGMKENQQDMVDAMANAIEEAITQLEFKTASYVKVDEAIVKAETLNQSDYKDFSKVSNTINAVIRDLDITQQSDVDAMANAIETAISELELKDGYDAALAALRTADASRNSEDIAIAKELANALDNGWKKNRLINRLNVIESQELEKSAYNEALTAVRKADASRSSADMAAARTLILKLNDGSGKTQLMNRLLIIQEQEAKSVTYEEALAALRTADASRTSEDIEIARDLASQLENGWQKTRLENRLAVIDAQELPKS